MSESSSDTEFHLPASGGALAASLGALTLGAFSLIAAGNLFRAHVTSLSFGASVLWLLGEAFLIVMGIQEDGGLRRHLVNRLGVLTSSQPIVRVTPGPDARITFGYRLCGRFRHARTIPVSKLTSIDWNTGQATSLAGRDMNDWHIAVWYHPPRLHAKTPTRDRSNGEVYLVGPIGPRAEIEPLARDLVSFLQDVGVPLVPGRNSCEFCRPSPAPSTP